MRDEGVTFRRPLPSISAIPYPTPSRPSPAFPPSPPTSVPHLLPSQRPPPPPSTPRPPPNRLRAASESPARPRRPLRRSSVRAGRARGPHLRVIIIREARPETGAVPRPGPVPPLSQRRLSRPASSRPAAHPATHEPARRSARPGILPAAGCGCRCVRLSLADLSSASSRASSSSVADLICQRPPSALPPCRAGAKCHHLPLRAEQPPPAPWLRPSTRHAAPPHCRAASKTPHVAVPGASAGLGPSAKIKARRPPTKPEIKARPPNPK